MRRHTPWSCRPEPGNTETWEIRGSDGGAVADVWPGNYGPEAAEDNAKLIVQAVNAHEDLLGALGERTIDKTEGGKH